MRTTFCRRLHLFPNSHRGFAPALCEASCCAGISGEPVTVRQIEYAIIENAFRKGYVEPYKPVRNTGMRVAVIGSGPAGLAAADALNKCGHEVVVFERNPNFGGLLRYGIPDFKLKKSVVERRIDVLSNSGILLKAALKSAWTFPPNICGRNSTPYVFVSARKFRGDSARTWRDAI